MHDQTRNQPDQPGERWVSVEEIVFHVGVDQKGLPTHGVRELWKFKVSEVDDWIRSGGTDESRLGSPPADKAQSR
jgi:hypothetical protein